MTEDAEIIPTTPRARGDIAAERACLCCKKAFWSEGFGERICPRCKSSNVWRNSVPGGIGQGHRRSFGRTS